MASLLQRRKSSLLQRRTSSIKPNIKPAPVIKKPNIKTAPVIKKPKEKPAVEFRWSTSVPRPSLPEKNSLLNFHLLDLDNSQQKAFILSPSSTARKSIPNPSPFPIEKCPSYSSHLPNMNNINRKRELSISTDEYTNGQGNPLSVHYSELHRAQIPSQTKKKSQAQFSLYPLSKHKRRTISVANSDVSLSSDSTSSSTNSQYIRLPASQLRRLNVSNKYMKEAQKLYFNPDSKVFVPRHSIVKHSDLPSNLHG